MKRITTIQQIESTKQWDIIVIGGGATGLGIGVDATSRGYKTLLLEQYDFAKGTSSKSTKLVHGGVRYLAQGDISLVLEALKERGYLLRNAPHLSKNQKFIIPNYEWWGGSFYTVGLKLYDLMAGSLGLGPSEHISKKEVLKAIPNLKQEGLEGGVIYYDGQFDDARLAINLAQTMRDNKGFPLNYCKVDGLLKDENGNISGVKTTDTETGKTYEINAKIVVNATGVFTDSIIKLDDKNAKQTIVPSQGVHIIIDKKFNDSDTAIMIPKTSDGRVIFAVPWQNKLVVGTTDTLVENIEIEPKALDEEVNFLLETVGQYLKIQPIKADILSVYAGLRPLVLPDSGSSKTKDVSRNHKISLTVSGLLTISGGKWTTYRRMAKDVVDKAIIFANLEKKKCVTKNMPIHGYVKQVDESDSLHLYGSDAVYIKALFIKEPKLKEYISDKIKHYKAEVVWSVRHEMTRTVEDFLARRTRCLLLDAKESINAAKCVATLIADELGYDNNWIDNQVKEYTTFANGYFIN